MEQYRILIVLRGSEPPLLSFPLPHHEPNMAVGRPPCILKMYGGNLSDGYLFVTPFGLSQEALAPYPNSVAREFYPTV